MNLKALAPIIVLFVSGCVTTEYPSNNRANTSLDTGRMVGPESSEWDTPPKLLRGKTPVYPISQALSKKSGVSVIVFTIGTDGRPKDFEVQSTTDETYANHAIIALREWVFQPAKKDGVPIDAHVRQAFDFGAR